MSKIKQWLGIGPRINVKVGHPKKLTVLSRPNPSPQASRRGNSSVDAAKSGSQSGWEGVSSARDEDAANKEWAYSLGEVLQRSQDLDANNPDLNGFHRMRVAQIAGSSVKFKFAPLPKSVNLDAKQISDIASRINYLRGKHSDNGGFDSTGNRRTEGMQQVRALLTTFIHGCCLIHRVWRPGVGITPLSLELIPGVRISTPYKLSGDPKISYGIEYSDTRRTRVVAYHVRRVSESRGNSFVPSYEWDRLPIEDCHLMSLIESAGMDRSMPISLPCIRMLRNRGEFIENAVSSSRAQSKTYATITSGPGGNPFASASDDMQIQDWQKLGDVEAMYLRNQEEMEFKAATIPGPDYSGFMDSTDGRLARGLKCAKSVLTREVSSSYAAGRMEAQQDEPLIDQYRDIVRSAWHTVNGWLLESLWLTSAIDMPGYSVSTYMDWNSFHAEFPGRPNINPVDTATATEKGYLTRTTTPQSECEQRGADLERNMRQWASAYQLQDEIEKEFGLEPGRIDFLVTGKTISTSSGEDIGAPLEEDPLSETPPKKKD